MIISKTPYRISFFGGGSDYPNWYNNYSGSVLSTTIDKHIYITCRHLPNFFNHKFRIIWSKLESVKKINLFIKKSIYPLVQSNLNNLYISFKSKFGLSLRCKSLFVIR